MDPLGPEKGISTDLQELLWRLEVVGLQAREVGPGPLDGDSAHAWSTPPPPRHQARTFTFAAKSMDLCPCLLGCEVSVLVE